MTAKSKLKSPARPHIDVALSSKIDDAINAIARAIKEKEQRPNKPKITEAERIAKLVAMLALGEIKWWCGPDHGFWHEGRNVRSTLVAALRAVGAMNWSEILRNGPFNDLDESEDIGLCLLGFVKANRNAILEGKLPEIDNLDIARGMH